MTASVVIGLDLGTSGLKAVALREDGEIQAEAEADCHLNSPASGWAEGDPVQWMAAVETVLAQIKPDLKGHDVLALGIDGHMHGVALTDADHTPTRPAVLWPDRRAAGHTERWRNLDPEQRARLANPISAGMAGPILAWLGEHEPDVLSASAYALQPKDFVRTALGGPAVTEPSDASATLMWDVVANDWAHDLLAQLGLPSHLLPEVRASDEVVAEVDLPALGHRNVSLVTGAGDTAAALSSCGGLRAGQIHLNLGTGAQVTKGIAEPRATADPVTHTFADADGGWYAMVGVQNAGLALARVREWLAMSWAEFLDAAAAATVGAGGVSFLPFLSGERVAIASPTSTGAWIGLTIETTRQDMARAAIEGVAFTLARAISLLDAPGDTDECIRLTGGGARHPLLPQLVADVTGRQIQVIGLRSPSAIGAALLAARGVGLSTSIDPFEGSTSLAPAPDDRVRGAAELWEQRRHVADA